MDVIPGLVQQWLQHAADVATKPSSAPKCGVYADYQPKRQSDKRDLEIDAILNSKSMVNAGLRLRIGVAGRRGRIAVGCLAALAAIVWVGWRAHAQI